MTLSSCAFGSEVGLRLLLSPSASNVIVRTACTVVGVGFPVYSTFKSIEKKDHADQEHWLVYWTVYGCFSVAEIFSDKLLSWVPFYHHAKFVMLIWIQLPDNYGARHVFKKYLCPFLLKHETELDRIVDGTRNELNNFILSHQGKIQAVKHTMQKLWTATYHVTEAKEPSIDTTMVEKDLDGGGEGSSKDNGDIPSLDSDGNSQTARVSQKPDEEPEWVDVFREDT